MKEIELFSSNDDFVIERISAVLKDRNIPYIVKESGAGSYINIVYGKSTMSLKKIIVSSEDYEEAEKVIDFLNIREDNKEPEKEMSNELKVIDIDEFGNKKYGWPAKILGGMVMLFFILLIIFWIVQVVQYLK